MGLHTGMPTFALVAVFLLLASPCSAVNTRQESSQKLRGTKEVWAGRRGSHALSYQIEHAPHKAEHAIMTYKIPANKAEEKDEDGDEAAAKDSGKDSGKEKEDNKDSGKEKEDDDDDDDDDDKESEEDKAIEKAREAKELKLKRKVEVAKAQLQENLDEQDEISAQISAFQNAPEGTAMIDASVKAVANQTESTAMAGYLGDMRKEMRMFQSPFYQEHIMERQIHLKRRERVLKKLHKAAQLKLKRQKLAWEKEDAKGEADDESDPKKKKEDEKKVAKLDKEEKKSGEGGEDR